MDVNPRAMFQALGRVFRLGGQPNVPPPLPAVPEVIPPHIILAGSLDAGRLWCQEMGVYWRAPGISFAVSGTDLLRHLRGRHMPSTTVVFVYGHGRNPTWAEAYEYTEAMRRHLGLTVVWHES